MARTLIIGDEIAIPTSAGTATSLAQATVVRVVNVSGATATVGVSTLVGATGNLITIPDGKVEYIEKRPNEVVYASGTVRGAKVGFTA